MGADKIAKNDSVLRKAPTERYAGDGNDLIVAHRLELHSRALSD